MQEPLLTLAPRAVDSLRRTRPWIFLLAAVTVIGCVLLVIILIAGFAGVADNPPDAHRMIAFAIGGLVVAVPLAAFEVGYAMALADIERARGDDLRRALERACLSQRNLWIATAVALGLGGLLAVFQTLDLLFF